MATRLSVLAFHNHGTLFKLALFTEQVGRLFLQTQADAVMTFTPAQMWHERTAKLACHAEYKQGSFPNTTVTKFPRSGVSVPPVPYSSVKAECKNKEVAGHLKRPSPAGVGRPPEVSDWEP